MPNAASFSILHASSPLQHDNDTNARFPPSFRIVIIVINIIIARLLLRETIRYYQDVNASASTTNTNTNTTTINRCCSVLPVVSDSIIASITVQS
mmetsp:Transcript_9508/g.17107  ORF Transcript_9508/g.17107 Transcript_9508/m.17107 type:complete len:95 (+) Transcript_9508:532-816(+)